MSIAASWLILAVVETPTISSGIPAVNNVVNPVLGEAFAPNPAGSVNPLYVWTFILSIIEPMYSQNHRLCV